MVFINVVSIFAGEPYSHLPRLELVFAQLSYLEQTATVDKKGEHYRVLETFLVYPMETLRK